MLSLFSSIIDNINSLNIGVIAIISLIALATKELAMPKTTNMAKYLNASIIIMLVLFLYLLAYSITKVLSAAT